MLPPRWKVDIRHGDWRVKNLTAKNGRNKTFEDTSSGLRFVFPLDLLSLVPVPMKSPRGSGLFTKDCFRSPGGANSKGYTVTLMVFAPHFLTIDTTALIVRAVTVLGQPAEPGRGVVWIDVTG